MDSEPPTHPVLAEEVEHALEPYRDLVTAEELEWFRSVLTEQLASDPMIARLARRAGDATEVDRSDEIPVVTEKEAAPEPAKLEAGRGPRRRPKG